MSLELGAGDIGRLLVAVVELGNEGKVDQSTQAGLKRCLWELAELKHIASEVKEMAHRELSAPRGEAQ